MPDRFSAFTHLSSPKSADYRAVLAAFASARAGFVIHLRPAEVTRATGFAEETLDAVLDQLAEWGNLDRSHDHVDAVTVEEFYRVKWLYQLSTRGEAAERALETFEQSLHQPGELQTEALHDIIEYLEAIRHLLSGDSTSPQTADYAKLHQQFRELNTRFEEFTVQAQRFMQFLQSTIELHDLSEDDFIDYKDRLIDYLQRFVNELITSAAEIEGKLEALERADVRDYFSGIAERHGIDGTAGADARREAWSTIGVTVDDLSAPALCLNLRPAPGSKSAAWIAWHVERGEPFYLSWRQARDFQPDPASSAVFVCENPAIVSEAANRLGADSLPLVCLNGVPAGAVRALLQCLVATDIPIFLRADFDWAGLRILDRLHQPGRTRLWRITPTDYRACRPSQPLTGIPFHPEWAAELAATMEASGLAAYEEELVDELIDDLRKNLKSP